jgi:hypothetical protein
LGSCYKIRIGGWDTDDAGVGTLDINCSAFGDADHDGDVDLYDWQELVQCLGGPNVLLPACEELDLNDDGAVDLADVGLLQKNFTGSNP